MPAFYDPKAREAWDNYEKSRDLGEITKDPVERVKHEDEAERWHRRAFEIEQHWQPPAR